MIRLASRMLVAIPFLTAVMLASCSSPTRHPAVPVELADRATVLNNPGIRTWDDALSQPFLEEIVRASKGETNELARTNPTASLPPAYYLAISGGGSDGAFGAGILCGWTAAGTRPEFKVVTGVSTGALTAPFAYLGPKYDHALRKVYTSVKTDQIATSRNILSAIYGDSLMDTVPLRHLLESLVNEEMMRDIATEYKRGRLLLVATTNLDANRGVIWNIGALAASGDPKALTLVRDILIGSAAIPAAFPPVMVDVEIDGTPYQEMHVDGGAKAQVFLYPPSFALKAVGESQGIYRDRVAYVIRNGRLDSNWASVQRRTFKIAGRAISSLIQTQGVGDLLRIYVLAERDDVDFNLAYIPATFNVQSQEDFDPVYMAQLFDVGYQATVAAGGYPWAKTPPGYVEAPGTSPSTPPAR